MGSDLSEERTQDAIRKEAFRLPYMLSYPEQVKYMLPTFSSLRVGTRALILNEYLSFYFLESIWTQTQPF